MVTRCLAILACLLVGCGSDETIYVSSEFTSEERAEIQRAADEWESVMGAQAHVDLLFGVEMTDDDIRSKTGHKLAKVSPNDPIVPELAGFAQDPTWTGLTAPMGAGWEVIFVSNGTTEFYATVLHEFGHHFGLHHSTNEADLMYARNLTTCITIDDAKAYCAANGCTPSHDMTSCPK